MLTKWKTESCVPYVTLREKSPNTGVLWSVFSFIRTEIQENAEQKKVRIRTLFTQCYLTTLPESDQKEINKSNRQATFFNLIEYISLREKMRRKLTLH